MPKVIILKGDVGFEITASKLKSQLPSDGSDVSIRVSSPGGFVFEGIDLFNTIKDYKGIITVIIDSLAASAASFFIMAAHKRLIRKNSTFMAHKTFNFVFGDADDMETQAKISNGYDNILAVEYARVSGKGKEEILSEMKNEIWLFGDEIIEAKFADGFIEGEKHDDEGMDDGASVLIDSARARVDAVKARMEKTAQFARKAVAKMSEIANSSKFNNSIDLGGNGNQGKENKTVEVIMNLEDLLIKNPEAKADIEKNTKAAIATAIKQTTKSETTRISELLNLSGVQVSVELKTAIDENQDAGTFAKSALVAERKANAESDEQKLGDLKASSQLPKDSNVKEDLPEGAMNEEETKAAAKDFGGNK